MDKYSFRYTQHAYNQLASLFEYWLLLHPNRSTREVASMIDDAFVKPCSYPKMKQVVEPTFETNYAYRRVNVWRFAFLYRIDEERKELVIDRIYHERAGA